jgi:hypothetical protein
MPHNGYIGCRTSGNCWQFLLIGENVSAYEDNAESMWWPSGTAKKNLRMFSIKYP